MDKVDMNVLDKDQCTPLCLAIRQENYSSALSLIEGGADVNKGGGIFGSPLHLAIVRLKLQIIEALVQKGAKLSKRDSDGNTPVHLIMNIFSKNPERCCYILDILLFNGAKINDRNFDYWAPLHIAVKKN
jgi:ankyrin repeat protein